MTFHISCSLKYIKSLEVQPNLGIRTVNAKLYHVGKDDPIQFRYGTRILLKRISVPIILNKSDIDKVSDQIRKLPNDHSDIFHREYSVHDSGNIIDTKGFVSSILDQLKKKMRIQCQFNFDKLTLRRQSNHDLRDLHIDYYENCGILFDRKQGFMERYIFNIGNIPRSIAIADINPTIISDCLSLKYSIKSMNDLFLRSPEFNVVEVVTPSYEQKNGVLHGIKINVTDLLHSEFGYQGEFAAMLTNWVLRD
jgi:hypothetical protein